MKKILCGTCLLILGLPSAFAWTTYQQNSSPSALMNQGNSYGQNDLYSNNNNINPYSTFQSAYNPSSARNNTNAYGTQVNSYNGQFQGVISQPTQSANSITNPYGQHGGVYNANHPSAPYTPQKWNNPYSTYQNSYNDNSVRNNSEQYGVQYQDGNGYGIGANHIPGNYNTGTVSGSYAQSPFTSTSVVNPYDQNKTFY